MTWEQLLSVDNFQLAWRRIRNTLKNTTKDRLGLKVFSQSLSVHITQIIREVKAGIYEPQSPSILFLPKKSGRLRPFTLLHMRDRLLFQAIGNIIVNNSYDLLTEYADTHVFSPVLAGKDSDFVFLPSLRQGEHNQGQYLKFVDKQTRLTESGRFTHIVSADIASFYPSIDHSLLSTKLIRNDVLDVSIASLLENCLKIWSSSKEDLQVAKGLPIGYETSDLLANIFLLDVDGYFMNMEYLRYVDDIRIFAESKPEANTILRELDIALQQRGLALQNAKSKIEHIDDNTFQSQLTKLENQQILLSTIDRDIDSLNEVVRQETDAKLRTLVMNVDGTGTQYDENSDTPIHTSDEAPFFFALYRMREKNIKLRDVALQILDSYPHRSYAIVHYLSLFRDNPTVIDTLWEMVDDSSRYGQLRANCLRTLYDLNADPLRISEKIQVWIFEDDLSLSLCAIELFQKYPNELSDLVIDYQEIDKHLLYAIISTQFLFLETDRDKLKLISWCMQQTDYMLVSLGAYFVSTNLHLLQNFVSVSGLSSYLVEDFITRVSSYDVLFNIRNLFGLEYEISISEQIYSKLAGLNQVVVNMIFALETNRDEYLRNVSEFLVRFSQLYQEITTKDFFGLAISAAIEDAFEYSKQGWMKLSDIRSSTTFLGTRPALDHLNTSKLHEGIAAIVEAVLNEFEALSSENLERVADTSSNTSTTKIPLIFFSYSHADESGRSEIAKTLKYLELRGMARLWSDRQIPAGGIWNDEINEKMNESSIVLFLITRSFMGSEFIHHEEMPRAIENYHAQKTVCVPILLEQCVWKLYPYQHLQALPDGAKPLTQWAYPDAAYQNIQEQIQKVLVLLKNREYPFVQLPPPEE
ncbi:MAG: TIR domain-containing protein [Anaerolineaceae bacterium]|nr:TIR domain-containing protein [Anaerolineaceae bacterium]